MEEMKVHEHHTGLKRRTRLGITMGEVIAMVGLFGAIITAWVSINVQVSEQKTINQQQEIRIELLERGRQENSMNIQKMSEKIDNALSEHNTHNREDLSKINDKLDQIIREMRKF